jgi:hypothetical protein
MVKRQTKNSISKRIARSRSSSKTRSRSKTNKKVSKKKSRKQKGGICYGNGVGANTYDPNFSIYNTNTLKLFPYKPSV